MLTVIQAELRIKAEMRKVAKGLLIVRRNHFAA